MKRAYLIGQSLLVLSLAFAHSCLAGEKSAADWQKQSLKGITSLRYAAAEGNTYDAMADLASALAEVKVPLNRVENLKADYAKALAVNEGRVKVVAQKRENKQSWVGLCVDQRCQLKRTPSINLDSETYQIGKMCPDAQVKSTVKDLCGQFVKDFAAQAK
ncbi:MAG: hypothetical protein K2W82_07620 [Candidatus Obscuribacterales bacterium]|nr:hypothetical protein [Candidatus Obscuribacterales bacterium]